MSGARTLWCSTEQNGRHTRHKYRLHGYSARPASQTTQRSTQSLLFLRQQLACKEQEVVRTLGKVPGPESRISPKLFCILLVYSWCRLSLETNWCWTRFSAGIRMSQKACEVCEGWEDWGAWQPQSAVKIRTEGTDRSITFLR
jgi:hypothetical protein